MKRPLRSFTRTAALLCLAFCTGLACAQGDDSDLRARLIDKPLYLKGFWSADDLRFDASGKLLSTSQLGSFTLSGIAIKGIDQHRDELTIRGNRVALVADHDSDGLTRREITSTTHILFSMRRKKDRDFHAAEEIRITIASDAEGHFNRALSAIFAEGLEALIPVVPAYWQCYAEAYFRSAAIDEKTREAVDRCVITPAAGVKRYADGQSVGPSVVSLAPLEISPLAADLGIEGVAVMHVRVQPDGQPVGLQVVHPLGAGMDEAVLQAISRSRFLPGTHNGAPVPMNYDLKFRLSSSTPR